MFNFYKNKWCNISILVKFMKPWVQVDAGARDYSIGMSIIMQVAISK